MLTKEQEIGELLKEVGAWQSGHFLLSSGLHSNQYVQCQKVLQYPRYGQILGEAMAKMVRANGLLADAVVGPALGAVHWEVFVAAALDPTEEEPVRAIFAERQPETDEFQIRRGIELSPGEKVLVVEDVTTTGGSAKKVVDLVRKLGAEPIAVATLVDRSASTVSFDVPFLSLLKLNLQTYEPRSCPMCTENVPISKPGSSKKPG